MKERSQKTDEEKRKKHKKAKKRKREKANIYKKTKQNKTRQERQKKKKKKKKRSNRKISINRNSYITNFQKPTTFHPRLQISLAGGHGRGDKYGIIVHLTRHPI